jgi:two-component system response regulator PhcR
MTEGATEKPDARTTVVIVDDEHRSLKYFARLFGSEFEVLSCGSAEEAEALFDARDGKISVIISDHRMPSTTGVTLLTRIKERWPDTVRLLTTAYADTESLAASINTASVHRFVSKPWDLDELRQALEDAAKSYSSKSAAADAPRPAPLPPLVGIVAHELATPLLSIEMTSKSLLEAAAGEGTQAGATDALLRIRRAATRIGEDAAHARRLARCLADLARDTAAASAANFQRVSMRFCVERALALFPFKGDERDRVAADISADFVFLGSDILMTAVLTNLLNNAVDATRGDKDARVTVTLSRDVSHNTVVIADTGPGFAPGIKPRLFQPFVTSKQDGTGLGLAICDWIIKSMGGTITASSPPQTATRMEIRLPDPKPQIAAV